MIKQNEGNLDKNIRKVAGVLLIILGLTVFTGTLKIIALVLGTVILITGLIGYCALYSILGINTCNIKNDK